MIDFHWDTRIRGRCPACSDPFPPRKRAREAIDWWLIADRVQSLRPLRVPKCTDFGRAWRAIESKLRELSF
jgi:hypothetical protein